MTKHTPIEVERHASTGAIIRALSDAVGIAERMPNGRAILGAGLCAALDTVCAGAPRYEAFGNMREDARWWADTAAPVEIELIHAACLRRIGEMNRAGLAMRARKRVFMDMWQAMPTEDQKAFLAKVNS